MRIKTLILIFISLCLVNKLSYSQSLKILYPNGAEILTTNTTTKIKWQTGDIPGKVIIILYKNGLKYHTVTPGTANTGIFSWHIPVNFTEHNKYRLRIRSLNDLSINDFSDRDFKILKKTGPSI